MPNTQADPEAAAEAVPAHVRVLVRVVAEPDAARRIRMVYQEDGENRLPLRKSDPCQFAGRLQKNAVPAYRCRDGELTLLARNFNAGDNKSGMGMRKATVGLTLSCSFMLISKTG